MGLGTIAALRTFIPDATIVVGARYPHQVAMARAFGADVVATGDGLSGAVRRTTGSHRIGASLSGGADAVIDGVGSSASISQSISMARPRGRVVLLGMPARVSLDMTALWHREVELRGCYTYGTEVIGEQRTTSFNLAIDLAQRMQAERLLSATYRIDQHVDAIAHAAAAGRRGAVKVAFDLRGAE
jgi:threonine dehydrogenase-like Zn-dependent dehydrogenase